MSKISHRTEKYFGSARQVHTVKWDPSEVDGREVKKGCNQHFGMSGYQEELNSNRWLDNIEKHEIMLCNDEDLTHFLLVWE